MSDAKKRAIRQQAQSNGLAAALGALAALLSLPKPPPKAALDPETADLTEEERLARLKQSGQYQAYQEHMQAWRQEQEWQTDTYPMCTPLEPAAPKPWWLPSFSVEAASDLVRAIPSVGLGSNRVPVPIADFLAPGAMISLGTVTAWNLSSSANPGAELRKDGFGAGTLNEPGRPSAFIDRSPGEVSSKIGLPAGFEFRQDGFSGSLGCSMDVRAKWNGWHTTVSVDLNYADIEVNGAGIQGNISKGLYVEVKPLQVATVGVLMTAAVLTPFDELTVLARGGWIVLQEGARQILPRLVPGSSGG